MSSICLDHFLIGLIRLVRHLADTRLLGASLFCLAWTIQRDKSDKKRHVVLKLDRYLHFGRVAKLATGDPKKLALAVIGSVETSHHSRGKFKDEPLGIAKTQCGFRVSCCCPLHGFALA